MTAVARRRPRALVVLALCLLLAAALLVAMATRLTAMVRDRATAALSERFDADVEMASLRVSIFPKLQVDGGGLVLRPRAMPRQRPLLQVGQFSAEAGLAGLLATPMRIRRVHVADLVIHVPASGGGERRGAGGAELPRGLRLGEIVSERARLEIGTSRPGRAPRVFEIHDLRLTSVGEGEPMSFRAQLTNPAPRGEIDATGEFGPWRRDGPGLTPVSGRYTFEDADLGTFDGLAGTLSSAGRFGGTLERIAVSGATSTPEFQIDTGQPVPLTTRFEAVVDGTSGDTYLERVEAQFLETRLRAAGVIAGVPDGKGREIRLEVTLQDGRIEDVLQLAVRPQQPPLRGGLDLETRLHLPPGAGKVVDRLLLDGTFALQSARFSDPGVQRQIETLSRRGRGDTRPPQGEPVISDMGGRFTMRAGRIRFAPLVFAVRGATVRLEGHYAVREESLDFKGNLLLAAKLSETVGGWKSWLAKPFDPLFRRDGRTVVPIKVSGSRSSPDFGLDVKRALTPGP